MFETLGAMVSGGWNGIKPGAMIGALGGAIYMAFTQGFEFTQLLIGVVAGGVLGGAATGGLGAAWGFFTSPPDGQQAVVKTLASDGPAQKKQPSGQEPVTPNVPPGPGQQGRGR